MKLDVLDRISFWEIEKLHIENNPLCTNYSTADEYTRCYIDSSISISKSFHSVLGDIVNLGRIFGFLFFNFPVN